MSRVVLAAASAVSVGLLGAGCGGSSTAATTSTAAANPTQAWASSVCGALTTWKGSLAQARDSLGEPGSVSKNSLTAALDSVRAANAALAASVKGLERPPSVSGEQATDTLDTLRGQLESGAKQVQSILANPDPSQRLATVSRVTGTLATMKLQIQTAVDDIEKLDVKGEIDAAFRQSPACQPFLEK